MPSVDWLIAHTFLASKRPFSEQKNIFLYFEVSINCSISKYLIILTIISYVKLYRVKGIFIFV